MGNGNEIRAKYRFLVSIEEVAGSGNFVQLAGFTTIGGLELEVNVVDWRVGDVNETKKLPGFINYPAITMERGYDEESKLKDLFDLSSDISNGSGSADYRKNYKIDVLNRDTTIFKTIMIKDGWISKYTSSDLDAKSEDPWVESIELQHNGWYYAAL